MFSVIRFEHGDRLPHCIERFAEEKGISVGHVILIGGIGDGEVVVGPRRSDERPPEPVLLPIDGAHEVAGVGVIAPGEDGKLAFGHSRRLGAIWKDDDRLSAAGREHLAGG